MNNEPQLPRFARRREWMTQRALCVCGVDTIAELVKGLNDGDVTISQLLRARGIGKGWVTEFANQFDIKAAIDRYHEHCTLSNRLDYKGPQPDYRAD